MNVTQESKNIYSDITENTNIDPLERLRYFCSITMTNDDWPIAKQLFDAIVVERANKDQLLAAAHTNIFSLSERLTKLLAAIKAKGGNEHYPTEWAYEQACRVIKERDEYIAKKDAVLDVYGRALETIISLGVLFEFNGKIEWRLPMKAKERAASAIQQAQEALK